MELRRMTYTPWATTVKQLISRSEAPTSTSGSGSGSGSGGYVDSCKKPEPLLANASMCAKHIPVTDTPQSFTKLFKEVSSSKGFTDPALLYIRIGDLPAGGLTKEPAAADVVGVVDAMAMQAAWSWRVYSQSSAQSAAVTTKEVQEAAAMSPHATNGKRLQKVVTDAAVCDGRTPHGPLPIGASENGKGYPVIDLGGNVDPASAVRSLCQTVLVALKGEKPAKAHWDVAAITIDISSSSTGGSGGEKEGETGVSSSLQALLALNLDFMRPKFIVARILQESEEEVYQARKDHVYLNEGEGEGGLSAPVYPRNVTTFWDLVYLQHAPGDGRSTKKHIYDSSSLGVDTGDKGDKGKSSANSDNSENDWGRGDSVHQALRFLTRHGFIAHSSAGCALPGAKEGQAWVCVWGTLINTIEIAGGD